MAKRKHFILSLGREIENYWIPIRRQGLKLTNKELCVCLERWGHRGTNYCGGKRERENNCSCILRVIFLVGNLSSKVTLICIIFFAVI